MFQPNLEQYHFYTKFQLPTFYINNTNEKEILCGCPLKSSAEYYVLLSVKTRWSVTTVDSWIQSSPEFSRLLKTVSSLLDTVDFWKRSSVKAVQPRIPEYHFAPDAMPYESSIQLYYPFNYITHRRTHTPLRTYTPLCMSLKT